MPAHLDADAFLDAFAAELPVAWGEVAAPEPNRRSWSAFVLQGLGRAATRFEMECCTKTHGDGAAWARREHLYDATWFAKDCGDYALPALILEHENDYKTAEILRDFWKLLFGWAPLRVMIGYTKEARHRAERVAEVNAVLHQPSNAIGFPPDVTDLLLLGHWGMSPRGFAVWKREGNTFLPYRSELSLPAPANAVAWDRWRSALEARAESNVTTAVRRLDDALGDASGLPADMQPGSTTSVATG